MTTTTKIIIGVVVASAVIGGAYYFYKKRKENTNGGNVLRDDKALPTKEKSELLIKVGRVLEEFLVLFFDIKTANLDLQKQHKVLLSFTQWE